MEEEEESPLLIKYGQIKRCKSENHVPIEASFQELRMSDDPSRTRRATDFNFQVPDHQEIGREKFFNPMSQSRRTQARHRPMALPRCPGTGRIEILSGFNLSRKASLANHTMSWWNNLKLCAKRGNT